MTGAVRRLVRTVVDGPGPDRHLGPEIDAVVELLASGAVTDTIESLLPPLTGTDFKESR